MTMIGSIGLGLVWGWLLILVGGRGVWKRPFLTPLLLSLATLLIAVYLLSFTNFPTMLIFLLAATVAAFFHLAWQHELRRRFSISSIQYPVSSKRDSSIE
jgi:hypothetical protein